MLQKNPFFWKSFSQKHWNLKPIEIPSGIIEPFISPEELFQIIIEFSERYKKGENRNLVRLFVGKYSLTYSENIIPLLPKRKDRSIEGYSSRIINSTGQKEWGLIINIFYIYDFRLWEKIRDFYAGIYEKIGFHSGIIEPDIFIGTYRRTPFGLHKDAQHVFTNTIYGKKVFSLWPYEAFADQTPPSLDLRERSFNLGKKNKLPKKSGMITLKADKGDWLYWPPSYWHIADSKVELVATLGFGIRIDITPSYILKKSMDHFLGLPSINKEIQPGKICRSKKNIKDAPLTLTKALADPRFHEILDSFSLALSETIFFSLHPSRPRLATLTDETLVISQKTVPMRWRKHNDLIILACNGRFQSLKFIPGVIEVFQFLNKGQICTFKSIASNYKAIIGTDLDLKVVRRLLEPLLQCSSEMGYISFLKPNL